MTHSTNELTYYTGRQAAAFAEELWDALDERHQRTLLYDLAPEVKRAAFVSAISKAEIVGVVRSDAGIVGFGWIVSLLPGSRCATAHFAFADVVDDEATEAFWEDIKNLNVYDSVLVVQPLSYRAARAYVQRHGFVVACHVPGMLKMYGRKSPCTGVLLVKDLR